MSSSRTATEAASPPDTVPAEQRALTGRAETMTVLETHGLTKAFSGNVVLRNVDFRVRAGEIHALMGENGAGKSTLLKLITGVHAPDEGTIVVNGHSFNRLDPHAAKQQGIATVYQELSLSPHLTVAENIFLGRTPTRSGQIDYRRINRESDEELRALGVEINPEARTDDLSLAERQLVEFVKARMTRPKLLILDEATSALESHQVGLIFGAMRRMAAEGTGIVFVSHRLDEVFAISDRMTVLKNGEYVATVETADTSTAQLVQYMVGRPMEMIFPAKPAIDEVLAQPAVLEVRNLRSGRRFRDVSFELHRGEILGLGGLQGQGQRALLAALFGLHRTDGEVLLNGQAIGSRSPRSAMSRKIAYVPEDRKTEGLLLPQSVKENLTLPNLPQITHGGLLDRRRENRLVADLVRKLQVRLRSPKQPVLRLSGGNQQKVAIAKWLPLAPDVFLLAEPTRGIDVGTKQEIYTLMRQLADAGASIILISSDTIELLGLSDRVLVMYEHRPVAMLAGDDVTEENIVHATVAGRRAGEEEPVPITAESPTARTAPTIEHAPAEAVQRKLSLMERYNRLPQTWQDVGPIFAVLAVFAAIYVYQSRDTIGWHTINNLSTYLLPLMLASMAQSIVMLTGGIDLSLGAMLTLGTALLATRMEDTFASKVGSVLLVLLAGAAIGLFTGSVVSYIRLPAIIVTLATSFIWMGMALYTLPQAGGHLPRSYSTFFKHQIFGIIPVTLVILALALLAWRYIKRSPLGLGIYAVGDNPTGAFYSGVNVRLARIAAYVTAGVFVMLAASALAGYTGTSDPTIGPPYTLMSITAAVLGGVSFLGGQGLLRGAVAGALTFGLLIQILTISGFDPAYQRIVQGLVLIIALGIKAITTYRLQENR
ncbi:MAG TPA: ATP-binding cassette domain-containing protein [Thermomicrobiales bacterium]|nr:ATP-binding cassette domain-containing protein [Thermomicrobiales bacterium]